MGLLDSHEPRFNVHAMCPTLLCVPLAAGHIAVRAPNSNDDNNNVGEFVLDMENVRNEPKTTQLCLGFI